MCTYASSRVKKRPVREKLNSRCFCWFPVPKRCTNMGPPFKALQKCVKHRQITQKPWATKTWDLDKLFKNNSFITFHFLGFLHWTVSNLLFFCCMTVNLYNIYHGKRLRSGEKGKKLGKTKKKIGELSEPSSGLGRGKGRWSLCYPYPFPDFHSVCFAHRFCFFFCLFTPLWSLFRG